MALHSFDAASVADRFLHNNSLYTCAASALCKQSTGAARTYSLLAFLGDCWVADSQE